MAPVLPTFQPQNNNIISIVQSSDSSNYSIVNNKSPPVVSSVPAVPPTTIPSIADQKAPILHIKPKSTPIIKEVVVQKLEVANDEGNNAKITLKIGQWKKSGAGDNDRLISIKNTVLTQPDASTDTTPVLKTERAKSDDDSVTITQDVNDVKIKGNEIYLNECAVKMEIKKDEIHTSIDQNIRNRTASIGIIMSPVIGRKRKR